MKKIGIVFSIMAFILIAVACGKKPTKTTANSTTTKAPSVSTTTAASNLTTTTATKATTTTTTLPSFTVNFNANGGTLVSGDESQTIKQGCDAVAPVYTKTGYECSFDKSYEHVINNLTVNAVWTALEYAITYDLDEGIETTNPETYNIEDGQLFLNDPIKFGAVFNGWEMDGEIVPCINCSLLMPVTLKATWTTGVEFSYTSNADSTSSIYALTSATESNATDIKYYEIPEMNGTSQISTLSYNAFEYFTNLEILVIGNNIKTIKGNCFSKCINLKTVVFDGTLEDWCEIAFDNLDSNPMCNAENFYCKDAQGNYYKVTDITIPSDVNTIKTYTFYGFDNTNNVTIPASVTSFEASCFDECTGLNNVYYEGTLTEWCKIFFANSSANPMDCGKHFFLKNTSEVYEEVVNIIIPFEEDPLNPKNATLSEIKAYTFYGFNQLYRVVVDRNITSIGTEAFTDCNKLVDVVNNNPGILNIGKGKSTYGNIALKALNVSNTTNNIIYVNDFVFAKEGTVYYLVAYIGDDADITLPTITISNSVVAYRLYDGAFSNVDFITTVRILENLDNKLAFNDEAFIDCRGLTDIFYFGDETSLEDIGFENTLTNVEIHYNTED